MNEIIEAVNRAAVDAETKAAALSAKLGAASPEEVPLAQIDAAVTQIAARALGFPEAGQIAEGKAADCLLIDLNAPAFAAGNDPDADFLYAGDTSCVDTVICAGRILMQGKIVPGEAAIVAAAREAARKLRGE